MIGPVVVRLYVKASVPYIDLHARLCDVTPRGRSINIQTGSRVSPMPQQHTASGRV